MCLFTSSLFVSGHLTPSFIIPFLKVSLCLFRMGNSLIKRSEFWEPVWQGLVWSSIIVNLYREDLNLLLIILITFVFVWLVCLLSSGRRFILRHSYFIVPFTLPFLYPQTLQTTSHCTFGLFMVGCL